jgi:hypothetical protein
LHVNYVELPIGSSFGSGTARGLIAEDEARLQRFKFILGQRAAALRLE